MAGREGLVDTAVKTAETGYMSRRLMKVRGGSRVGAGREAGEWCVRATSVRWLEKYRFRSWISSIVFCILLRWQGCFARWVGGCAPEGAMPSVFGDARLLQDTCVEGGLVMSCNWLCDSVRMMHG